MLGSKMTTISKAMLAVQITEVDDGMSSIFHTLYMQV